MFHGSEFLSVDCGWLLSDSEASSTGSCSNSWSPASAADLEGLWDVWEVQLCFRKWVTAGGH